MRTLTCSCAVLACAGALLAPREAAAAPYRDTSGGIFTTRLEFRRFDSLTAAGGPYRGTDGYSSYSGGWIKGTYYAPTAPAADTQFTDNNVTFRLEAWEHSAFTFYVPSTVRDLIHIQVTLTRSPSSLGPNPSVSDTVSAQTTLGSIERNGLRWDPTFDLRWVDQRVNVRWEVWLDSSVATPLALPGHYPLDLNLRTRKSALWQLSPFLVPVGLIGQPPGNLSWSKMTLASSSGAGLAVTDGQMTSTTVQDSYGLGPIQDSTPQYTNWRSQTRGTQTIFSLQSALNFSTHPIGRTTPYGPGEGDLLFCLLRPTFEQYQTVADSDFRFVAPSGSPAFAYFPMRELLLPQPGTPWAQLTPTENAAFRTLNPLLTDPRAPLPAPRYVKVVGPIVGVTGALGGQFGTSSVTRREVDQARGSSTTTGGTSGPSLPLGALSSLIGSPLPVPDAFARHSEMTTSSVEYRESEMEQDENTILSEFEIADSDPTKVLWVEIYYDTLFRSFAFRDASPPTSVWERLRLRLAPSTTLKSWLGQREDWKPVGTNSFLIAGPLKKWAPLGGMATFRSADGKQSLGRAGIDPVTGNILMTGLKAGRYSVLVEARGDLRATLLTLTLDQEGVPTVSE